MWREIYLNHGGWSIAAWLGTAVVVGVIAGLAYAVADARVPRITRPSTTKPSRRIGDPK